MSSPLGWFSFTDIVFPATATRVSAIIDDNGLNFEKTMVREAQRLNVQKGELLVLALLPESAAGLYASVKRAGDIVHGVPTQCVVSIYPLIYKLSTHCYR